MIEEIVTEMLNISDLMDLLVGDHFVIIIYLDYSLTAISLNL